MNTSLTHFLPEFTREMQQALIAAGEADLAEQLAGARVVSCSYDQDCGAGYIGLEPPRTLNVVELNIVTVRHGRTVAVEHPYSVFVDTDNFNRVTGIELLSAQSLAGKLESYGLA